MNRINKCYLGLGTNIGDKKLNLEIAQNLIKESIGELSKYSNIIETKAWGNENQENFLNQVVIVNTHLSPLDLLNAIHTIEKKMGRQRIIHWGPRIIDIDILYFNNEVVELKSLKIPHPYIQERAFVLQSLVEIAPSFKHPLLNKTNEKLLEELTSKQ